MGQTLGQSCSCCSISERKPNNFWVKNGLRREMVLSCLIQRKTLTKCSSISFLFISRSNCKPVRRSRAPDKTHDHLNSMSFFIWTSTDVSSLAFVWASQVATNSLAFCISFTLEDLNLKIGWRLYTDSFRRSISSSVWSVSAIDFGFILDRTATKRLVIFCQLQLLLK